MYISNAVRSLLQDLPLPADLIHAHAVHCQNPITDCWITQNNQLVFITRKEKTAVYTRDEFYPEHFEQIEESTYNIQNID